MIKNKLSVYLIFISIFTSATIFVFIIQKSYSNLIGPSQQIETNSLLKPINPVLDDGIIQEIQKRPESIDYGNLNFIDDTQSVTPTITQPKESSNSSKIISPLTEE